MDRVFSTRDDVEVEARHLRDRKWENLIGREGSCRYGVAGHPAYPC